MKTSDSCTVNDNSLNQQEHHCCSVLLLASIQEEIFTICLSLEASAAVSVSTRLDPFISRVTTTDL